jgi:hypothetical protein
MKIQNSQDFSQVNIGKTLLNVRALQYRHYRKEENMSLNSHVVLNSCVI